MAGMSTKICNVKQNKSIVDKGKEEYIHYFSLI